MAAIEFKYETLYNESFERFGDTLQISAYVKSYVEKGGYYNGGESIQDIELEVFDAAGRNVVAELSKICPQEVKLIVMEVESLWNNQIQQGA